MFLKSRAVFEFRKPWHLQIQFSEKIESDRNLFLKSTEYDNGLY